MSRHSRATAPRRGTRFHVRPLLAALAAAGIVAPAHGATIVVTTAGDAGNAGTCTLRQAVESLNAASLQGACLVASGAFGTNDTVDLNLQTGTITLAGGLPLNSTLLEMSFDGPGAQVLTVSGAGASRVLEGDGLFVEGLTIANGRSVGPGGCILADELILVESVVTGCTATNDNVIPYYNAVGGGVAAKYLNSFSSSIIGNTATTGGGGAFVIGGQFTQTLVSGNTVLGHTCTSDQEEVCASGALGGGGILGETVLTLGSTISGNIVNAARLRKYDDLDQPYDVRVGLGGGIAQFPLSYIFGPALNPNRIKSAGTGGWVSRAVVAGASGRTGPARAALKAKAASGARNKADGQGIYMVGLSHSTVSGNRVTGSGPILEAKYAGGGVIAISPFYNAEIVNSTISGNRLEGRSQTDMMGSAILTGSVDLSNDTITANVGGSAVAIAGGSAGLLPPSSAKMKKERVAKLRATLERMTAPPSGRMKRGTNKDLTAPVFLSTIIGDNTVGNKYQVDCSGNCTISGANNLITSWSTFTTVPGDTLTSSPQLAPLAFNGGVLAGAPGHTATRPMPTHLLFTGSPAVDTGNNDEGWEFDQRGPGFPRVVGLAPDIGAIEGTIGRDIPVPALAPWLVAMLSALLGVLGLARRRRPS